MNRTLSTRSRRRIRPVPTQHRQATRARRRAERVRAARALDAASTPALLSATRGAVIGEPT